MRYAVDTGELTLLGIVVFQRVKSSGLMTVFAITTGWYSKKVKLNMKFRRI